MRNRRSECGLLCQCCFCKDNFRACRIARHCWSLQFISICIVPSHAHTAATINTLALKIMLCNFTQIWQGQGRLDFEVALGRTRMGLDVHQALHDATMWPFGLDRLKGRSYGLEKHMHLSHVSFKEY